MNSSRLFFSLAVLITCQARAASAQLLRGRAVEAASGSAIPGVMIRVLGADSMAVAIGVADDSGKFAIEIPRAGQYRIELSRIGYALRLSKSMQMAAAQVYELNNIQLATQPVPVAAVPVKAEQPDRLPALERNGYYTRRKAGVGHYIDRATIEKRAPQATSDLFVGVNGVKLSMKPGGGYYVYLRASIQHSMKAGNACAPLVFVDGVPVDGVAMKSPTRSSITTATDAFDFDLIHPNDIEAIEVYRGPAEIPPQYNGAQSACGVILVWRRVGPG